MTKTIVRSLLAAAVAAALALHAPAQSADSTPQPAAPPKAVVLGEVLDTERLQVRLAEVMSILEEDDLSPELKEQALAKLKDVRERLRKQGRLMGVGGVAGTKAPAKVRSSGGPVAIVNGEPMQLRTLSGTLAEVKTGEPVVVDGTDGATRVRRYAASKGSLAPAHAEHRHQAAEKAHEEALRAHERAAKAHEEALEVHTKMEEHHRRAVEKAVEAEHKAKAKAKARVRRADDEGESEPGVQVKGEKFMVRSRVGDTVSEVPFVIVDGKVAHPLPPVPPTPAVAPAAPTEVTEPTIATRVRNRVAKARADEAARAGQVSTFRRVSAPKAKVVEVDGDDEAELRATIDEMRAEMRAIRAMMQDLRREAEGGDEVDAAPARKAPRNAK
jgi:hypothetical protein